MRTHIVVIVGVQRGRADIRAADELELALLGSGKDDVGELVPQLPA